MAVPEAGHPQVGVTHEIVINGVGFRLKQPIGQYMRYRASDFAPALQRAIAANRPAIIDVATDIEALAPTAVS